MEKKIDKQLIVYVDAVCNLKCRYCFLSKNEGMSEVDKELEESFKDPKYYIDSAKHYFGKDFDELTELQVWGGEPLLHFDRVLPVIELLIEECNTFNSIMFSSNYSHNKVVESFKNLMDVLSKHPDRQFSICS